MRMGRMGSAGVLISALALGACAPAEPAVMVQPAAGLTGDASVAGTVSTANDGEIMHGRIAVERATNADVRAFAQRMIDDHTAADAQLRAVLDRMNTVEAASTIATQMEQHATQTAQTLRSVSASQFDRTYMDSQVSMHDWLLRTLDSTLIPATRNDELELQLRTIRGSVAAHLEQARQIRQRLGS